MAVKKAVKAAAKPAAKSAAKPAKTVAPKAEAKPATKALKAVKAKAVLTPEENLQKLAKSKLPAIFVKKHEGNWNHSDWLGFLDDIKEHGYDPIDTDSVGLILEEKKAQFLAEK